MNAKTEESRDWRAEQRRLGRIPKLIWPHREDWPKVHELLKRLKLKRELKKPG